MLTTDQAWFASWTAVNMICPGPALVSRDQFIGEQDQTIIRPGHTGTPLRR
jgi:hypothetical protein